MSLKKYSLAVLIRVGVPRSTSNQSCALGEPWVVWGHTRKDGWGATDALCAMLRGSKFLPQLHAVLLDGMMPGMDGLEVLRRIRERGAMPVLMLTARGDEADRVVGLELGADDYVTKPFSFQELSARMRAVLKRAGRGSCQLQAGALRLDPEQRRAWCCDRPLELSTREFNLLAALTRRPGRVFSREELLQRVWQPGQPVRLRVDAFPGREFARQVEFVYPTLDETTRTVAATSSRGVRDDPSTWPDVSAPSVVVMRSTMATTVVGRDGHKAEAINLTRVREIIKNFRLP